MQAGRKRSFFQLMGMLTSVDRQKKTFSNSIMGMLSAGKRGKYEKDNGEKFIAVEAGGKLEIHGHQRRL